MNQGKHIEANPKACVFELRKALNALQHEIYLHRDFRDFHAPYKAAREAYIGTLSPAEVDSIIAAAKRDPEVLGKGITIDSLDDALHHVGTQLLELVQGD
jgi:hypothetical protein